MEARNFVGISQVFSIILYSRNILQEIFGNLRIYTWKYEINFQEFGIWNNNFSKSELRAEMQQRGGRGSFGGRARGGRARRAPNEPRRRGVRQALEGSFSAVSKSSFASKYAFERSRRDLHKAVIECTPLHCSKITCFLESSALCCTALKSHFARILPKNC